MRPESRKIPRLGLVVKWGNLARTVPPSLWREEMKEQKKCDTPECTNITYSPLCRSCASYRREAGLKNKIEKLKAEGRLWTWQTPEHEPLTETKKRRLEFITRMTGVRYEDVEKPRM